jgi:hypothetical protein
MSFCSNISTWWSTTLNVHSDRIPHGPLTSINMPISFVGHPSLWSHILQSHIPLITFTPLIMSNHHTSRRNKTNMHDYINFLGIHNSKYTLMILLANGFHLHKLFKSPALSCLVVRELGLTLGVVNMLFLNVARYNQYLCSQQAGSPEGL